VYVASDGVFGSLDWVASPDLRDLETRIARETPPLPREALALTAHILQACMDRQDGPTDMIIDLDFQTGLLRYRSEAIHIDATQPTQPDEVTAP
jgi:hypothetical protein